ncbi:hypothetical protein PO909_029317 [Leuciscus waleckii]
MATGKTFFAILYLLLYSCLCTAEIGIEQVSQVEKGMSLSKDFLQDAVLSKTQLAVCKAIGPDGGWHSGFVKNQYCNYEYDWKPNWGKSYEVLVDPCGGRGWKWTEGAQGDMVSYDTSKRFQGLKYYVCSGKSDGLVGKLFNTRDGFMCHIARYGSTRDGNFYALVPQPCI